jgi:hypothetical protein
MAGKGEQKALGIGEMIDKFFHDYQINLDDFLLRNHNRTFPASNKYKLTNLPSSKTSLSTKIFTHKKTLQKT